MYNITLEENEVQNLLQFLDRAELKGVKESQALLQIVSKIEQREENKENDNRQS